MKKTIAIIGFTVACIGASEMLSAVLVDCGRPTTTAPSHPFTDADQKCYMVAEEAKPVLVGLFTGEATLGTPLNGFERIGIGVVTLVTAIVRMPRDCLRQFQCPIGKFPN